MSSSSPAPAPVGDDRSTRARIRDAAIRCVADQGAAATTVRAVARLAEVSPGSVIHHFGSAEGLRVACDHHVAAQLRARKDAAVRQGAELDPLAALRDPEQGHLLHYLAARLHDPSDEVRGLIAEIVDDAEANLALAVERGIARASDHPRDRAAVLVAWSLGALALHDVLAEVLGGDVLDAATDAGSVTTYLRGALDILGHGVLDPAYADQLRAAVDEAPDLEVPT